MKLIRIFSRNISDSFKSVFRNFSLSVASISCITITLILVAISIILSYNVNSFTSDIEKDVTIVIFLDKKIEQTEIDEIGSRLKDMKNVSKVTFESKEEIKNSMKKESEIFESIMDSWTEETNPLQDTYLVKVKDIDLIGETARTIKEFPKVDIVKYGEGMVEELVEIFDTVKTITYIVVVALIIVTAFLISNTIKITIQTRKRQIEIMRLVGASNSYIKLPFFFEGIILGFLGSLIPIFLSCYGYIYAYDKLNGQLFTAIIKLVRPDKLIYPIIIVVVAIGVTVGAFGSYRAVRRYLKI